MSLQNASCIRLPLYKAYNFLFRRKDQITAHACRILCEAYAKEYLISEVHCTYNQFFSISSTGNIPKY